MKFQKHDVVRHVKTMTEYVVVDQCIIEATGEDAYAYRAFSINGHPGTDRFALVFRGPLWICPANEMEDGRFVKVMDVKRLMNER